MSTRHLDPPGGGPAPLLTLRTLPPLPLFHTPHAVPPPHMPISRLKLSIVRILTGASNAGAASGSASASRSSSGNVITMTYAEQVKEMTLHGWRLQMIGLELRQNALIAPETRERVASFSSRADAENGGADEAMQGFELKDEHECALLEEGDEIVIRIRKPYTLADLQLPSLPSTHVYVVPAASLTRAGTLSNPPSYSSIHPQPPLVITRRTSSGFRSASASGLGDGTGTRTGRRNKSDRTTATTAAAATSRRKHSHANSKGTPHTNADAESTCSSSSTASGHSHRSTGSRASVASNTTAAFLSLNPHIALAKPREPSSHSSSVAITSATSAAGGAFNGMRAYPLASEVGRTRRGMYTLKLGSGAAGPGTGSAVGAAKVLTRIQNGSTAGLGRLSDAKALDETDKKRRPSGSAAAAAANGAKRRQSSTNNLGACGFIAPMVEGSPAQSPLGSPFSTTFSSSAHPSAIVGQNTAAGAQSSARTEAMRVATRRSNAALHPMYAAAASAKKQHQFQQQQQSQNPSPDIPTCEEAAGTKVDLLLTTAIAPPRSIVAVLPHSSAAVSPAVPATLSSSSMSPVASPRALSSPANSTASSSLVTSGSSVTQTARTTVLSPGVSFHVGVGCSAASGTVSGSEQEKPHTVAGGQRPAGTAGLALPEGRPSPASANVNSTFAESTPLMSAMPLLISPGVPRAIDRSASSSGAGPSRPDFVSAHAPPPVGMGDAAQGRLSVLAPAEPLRCQSANGTAAAHLHADAVTGPSTTAKSKAKELDVSAVASEKEANTGTMKRRPLLRQISSALSGTNLLGEPITQSSSSRSMIASSETMTASSAVAESRAQGGLSGLASPPTLPLIQHHLPSLDGATLAEARNTTSGSGTRRPPAEEPMSEEDQLALDAAIAAALAEADLSSSSPPLTPSPALAASAADAKGQSRGKEKGLPPMPTAVGAPTVVNGHVYVAHPGVRQDSFSNGNSRGKGSSAHAHGHQHGQGALHRHRQGRPSTARSRPSVEASAISSSDSSNNDKKLAGDAAQLQTLLWNEIANAGGGGSGGGGIGFGIGKLGRRKHSSSGAAAVVPAAYVEPSLSDTGTDGSSRRPSFVVHVQQRSFSSDKAKSNAGASSNVAAEAKVEKRFVAVQRELEKERLRQAEAEAARYEEIRKREAKKREEAEKKVAEAKRRKVKQQWEMWEEIRRREREAGLPPAAVADRAR